MEKFAVEIRIQRMSKQKKEQKKKRKREQVRKQHLEKVRISTALDSKGDRVQDEVMECMKRAEYEKARLLLLDYVNKNPRIYAPLGILAVACEKLEDFSTMFWATDRLVRSGPREDEDLVLYFNACSFNGTRALALHARELLLKTDSPPEGLKEIAEAESLEGFLEELRVSAEIDFPNLSGPLSAEMLWEFARMQEQVQIYLGDGKYQWGIQVCERMMEKFPEAPASYLNLASAILEEKGPAQAESAIQKTLAFFPDYPYALCFRIRQLAQLGRMDDIPPYLERLDRIDPASRRPEERAALLYFKAEALVWAKQYDRVLEIYQNAPEMLAEHWNVEKNDSCAILQLYASVILHRREEDVRSLLKEAASCEIENPLILANHEDYLKPDAMRNGPWFFYIEAYFPKALHRMLLPIFMRVPQDLEESEQMEWIRKNARPILRDVLKRWPHIPNLLVEMIRVGSEDSRRWTGMFLGVCDWSPFIEAANEFLKGTDGSEKTKNELRTALDRAGLLRE